MGAILSRMESKPTATATPTSACEAKESRRPSDKMRRAKVEALSEDEEVVTIRSPIAELVGGA